MLRIFYQSQHQPSRKNIKYTANTRLMAMFCEEIANAWLFLFVVAQKRPIFPQMVYLWQYYFPFAVPLKGAIFSQFLVKYCYSPRLGCFYLPSTSESPRPSSLHLTSALTIGGRIASCQNSDQYMWIHTAMKTSNLTFPSILHTYTN
jgi:hypothetical protein